MRRLAYYIAEAAGEIDVERVLELPMRQIQEWGWHLADSRGSGAGASATPAATPKKKQMIRDPAKMLEYLAGRYG